MAFTSDVLRCPTLLRRGADNTIMATGIPFFAVKRVRKRGSFVRVEMPLAELLIRRRAKQRGEAANVASRQTY